MKKINFLSLILPILFFTFLSSSYANYKEGDNGKGKKPIVYKTAVDPYQSLINVNQASMWVTAEGFHDWVVASGWNGAYPFGTQIGAIFAEGIIWGGIVSDGTGSPVRVDGNTYGSGTSPITRLYRVRPDFLTGDITADVASFLNIPIGQVSASDIQTVRDQYQKDVNEWPAGDLSPYGNQGAPYKDVNKDGKYDPAIDIPGIPGASQTIFIKYNDNFAGALYGSIPIGLEVSETYWAYAYSGALGNVIYKKVDLIYKGIPGGSANSRIDKMYIVQWADPDVGTSSDDFAGCDTTLNLGYAYNSTPTDGVYAGVGLPVPAVGYDFLQGVSKYTGNPNDSAMFDLKWRKGYKYVNRVPMSSFVYFAAGGTWSDPDFNPDGTFQFYNLMRGSKPDPLYPTYSPFPDAAADYTAEGVYLLPGDPVTGTGKLDGDVDATGDRRIMVTNGPISMNLGDTAQVVLALVYGMGTDNLSSITAMKTNDETAQIVFDQLFQLPSIEPPKVEVTNLDKKVIFNWGNDAANLALIENYKDRGYTFEGYEVYQLPSQSSKLSDGVLLGTFDVINEIKAVYDTIIDPNGVAIPVLAANGTDKGIQRYYVLDYDNIKKQSLYNDQEYYVAVVAYAYNPSPLLPFHALRSPVIVRTVIPQSPELGVTLGEAEGNSLSVTHATGVADGVATATVVDPTVVTGHDYEIFFTQVEEVRNSNGDWVPAGVPKLHKPNDLTGTSITIAGLYGPNPQSGVELSFSLDLVSSTYSWADGITITFPAGVTVLSAPSFEAGGGPIVPEIVGNVVNMGLVNGGLTQNGIFHGGETWSIFIAPPALPVAVDWYVYDDGYIDASTPTGVTLDASGTYEITTIGSLSRTSKYWNVRDLFTNQVVLSNQGMVSGFDVYPKRDDTQSLILGIAANPIVEGMQIGVDGSYVAPTTFSVNNPPTVNGKKMTAAGLQWKSTNYTLTNFMYFGYPDGTVAASLGAYVTGATGTTDVAQLQQDIELRWTGVIGDTLIGGKTLKITKSGGSYITLFGASGKSIANHPLNPNPGSTAPFLVRVPFEIWNIDSNQEITALFWDRTPSFDVDGGSVWNQTVREYLWVVNTPQSTTTPLDPLSQTVGEFGTWNLVLYLSTFQLNDIVRLNFDNPFLIGVDTYTFSTKGSTFSEQLAKNQSEQIINVFPNPYYGYQNRETSPTDLYVTFNHLPNNATIRIFDLSGVLVKTIYHTVQTGQLDKWNLQNENNYPVASGVYIVHIDMPDLGTTKILKLAIIQAQQMLKVY